MELMERVEKRSTVGEWLKTLDGLLRGDITRPSALRRGTIDVPLDGLAMIILVLGLLYGLCMGSYAVSNVGKIGPQAYLQLIATTGKVPVLFLLTLLVTFPSLYVFNALVGSRLSLGAMLRLIVAALAVMLAILASFGPIVAFFSVSTTSYQFMLLFNVAVFAVAGFLGLRFLLFTLHRLSIVQAEEMKKAEAAITPAPAGDNTPEPMGALDHLEGTALGSNITTIFRIWIVVFGLVGAQMSWVLRPFLGEPNHTFTLFRLRESNFFEAVFHAMAAVLR